MRTVARLIWLGLVVVPLVAPARAAVPIEGEALERALTDVARAPASPAAHAQLLAIAPALDALPAARQIALLDRLVALAPRAPLLAARARFERLALADPPPAPEAIAGQVTRALAVGARVTGGDGDLLSTAAATLASRGRAALGEALDPDAPELVWVEPAVGPRGLLALDALAPRAADRVVHVALVVCADAPRAVTLRLGTRGDVLVALDGVPVGRAEHLTRAVPDQLEVPLELAPGPHAALVTIAPSAAEAPGLYARWTDRAGRAIPWPACDPAIAWPPPADGEPIVAPDLTPPAWTRALAGAWRPLALARLGWPIGSDLADRLPDARLAPPFDRLALDALASTELRLTVLAQDPAASPVVEAALAADRGQLTRARDLLARAPAQDAEAGRLVRARVLREDGDPRAALALLLDGAPDDPPVAWRFERARAALAAGRAADAVADLEALVRAVPSPERVDLQVTSARALLAAGRPADAIARAAALARARPDRPALALDAAAQALEARDPATAEAMLALARPLVGWKPDALVASARLEAALGHPDEAAALLARALALDPAHEEARRLLERQAPEAAAPLTIVASAELGAAPPIDAEAPWEVLAEELVVHVADDGRATRWLRRVMRAQHPPSAREDRTFTWRFDPSQESVRVLDARVLVPPLSDGRFVPARERHVRAAAEDWYNLYFDVRVLEIPFDGLTPGALVEVTLRLDETAHAGQRLPGVFEHLEVLQDRVPKHLHRIVIEAPVALSLRDAVLGATAGPWSITTRREALADGRERLVMEARDLPATPREPLAPAPAELSPVWQVTSLVSWSEVARRFARLIQPQVVVTREMRARVAEIVAAERGHAGRIAAALVALVQRDIRYVGLEFGVHGHKPYRTDEVWARRFGDCKDQALLLETLLALAEVPADVALVRTRGQGRIAGALPSLLLFDHAIVHLTERGQFVDPTVVHHGMSELPAADQGAQVLLVADGAALATTPVDAPTRNQVVGNYAVTVDASGAGGIQGTVAFHGAHAPPYRELLADPATQEQRLQTLLNRRYPGLALESARLSDPEALEAPVELVFHARVSRIAARVGQALHVPRPAGIDGQAERVAGRAERTTPLILGPPMTFDLTFRYVVPAGFVVGELPPGGAADGPFGRWSVTWSADAGVASVQSVLTWKVDQIDRRDYPALREFIRAFDAAVAPPLVLEPAPAPPEATR